MARRDESFRSVSVAMAFLAMFLSSAPTTPHSHATRNTSTIPDATLFFASAASMNESVRTLLSSKPLSYTQSNLSSDAGGSFLAWHSNASARSRYAS